MAQLKATFIYSVLTSFVENDLKILKNLNVDVDFLEGVIPTAENIAIHIWDILEPKIESGALHEVKLFESERNFVVYHGASVERPN